MKKYKLIKNGEEVTTWTDVVGDENYYEECFGKKQWIEEIPEQKTIEIIDGVEVEKIIPPYQIIHKSEFEVVIEDITNEENKKKINIESLSFLSETDWYVIRELETGVKMPEEIREKRVIARSKVVH